MSRAWACSRCGKPDATDARRGPVPKLCDPCKVIVNRPPAPPPPPPWVERPPILRDPFNSTPATAALTQAPPRQPDPLLIVNDPQARASAQQELDGQPAGPGPLELQLTAELGAMVMINPTAKTQSLLAVTLARAADRLDPGDVKTMLTIGKELRAILDGLNKAPRAGGDDDDEDRPFGAVRPEIQHPPSV